MSLQSRAYITSNPTTACGHPLFVKLCLDPNDNSANERGLVVETSFHSINGRHGNSGRGDRFVSPRYQDGRFFLQGHADLIFRLTGGNTHSLTEGCTDEKP